MKFLRITNSFALICIIWLCAWFECNRTVLAQPQSESTFPEQEALSDSERQTLPNSERQTLPNSEQQTLPEQLPYKYYGHKVSHKFHRPTCPFGMCISQRNLVLFHFRKEAIEAHFVPCKYCLPPVWWTVHGVILPNKDGCPQNKIAPGQNAQEFPKNN
jgi:hypothetical protein